VVDQSKKVVRRTIVALSGASEDGVRIASGLSAGDMVVTAGVQFLRDGMRVRLLPERTAPPGNRI
jgi:multidrug efflux system membrane fusion protein